MGKVVTSAGLNDFVSTGQPTENIKAEKKPAPVAAAPPLEVKEEKPAADLSEKKEEVAPPVDDKYVDDDATIQAEIEKSERFNRLINKKHQEAKSFKALAEKRAEEIAEAERFAEQQFNERRLVEERERRLQAELTELKRGAPEAPKEPELKKPDPQKFYDDKGQFKAFEYAEELAAYSANKAVADDRAKFAEEQRQIQAAEAARIAEERVAETRKKHPDFLAVMNEANVETHPQLLQYLSASEHIGEVSYYLAKHPEYLQRINKMNPLRAIAEVGKLELTFEKPPEPEEKPAPPPSKAAPAPITPITTTAAAAVITDPSKMNFQQLRAFERQRSRRH
jgi:multidrug efflux pump subunit AcrA (membrane-fusion protein)